MKKYSYRLFLSCEHLFPIFPICLTAERYTKYEYEFDDTVYVREWGMPGDSGDGDEGLRPLPDHIYLCYAGRVEMEEYSIDHVLPDIDDTWMKYQISGVSLFSQVLVGIAPFGRSACWLWGEKKSVVISWVKSGEVEKLQDESREELLKGYDEAKENFRLNGLPDRNLYDGYMQKFRYRYVTELDESFTFDYIEEALFDGSHDKLHDGGLMSYHDAAKPKKLILSWHIEKSIYSAYFWFDEVQMRKAFEVCFSGKTDADADFIIRINPEQNMYGVALFRYGTAEPYEFPEDGYQLIVFRNDFEVFSSDNFSQNDGDWLW